MPLATARSTSLVANFSNAVPVPVASATLRASNLTDSVAGGSGSAVPDGSFGSVLAATGAAAGCAFCAALGALLGG